MKKKFISNLSFLLAVNLLIKPVWIFGIDRTVQNTVGTEAYGIYFALFNLSLLFHILIDMGITNYNNRNIARDHSLIRTQLANIFIIKVILSLFYILITYIIAITWEFDPYQLYLLVWLVINQILSSFILYFRSNLSGMLLFKTDSLLSIADKFLMIILCGVLLWGQPFGPAFKFKIEWFIYAQSLSYLLVFIFSVITVSIYTPKIHLRIEKAEVVKLLKQTYPFAILGLLMTIYYRLDALMIERLLGADGKKEAGIYAAGYRILDATNMVGYLFAGLLLPIFSRMLSNKEKTDGLLKLGFKLLFVISVAISIPSFFSREYIIHQLYTDSSLYMSDVFGWLILCFITISFVYVFGSLLTANANMKQLNSIAAFGVVCNILLNLLLIPEFKALGATWATFITQLIVALAHVYFAKKIFALTYTMNNALRLMVFVCLVFALCILTTHLSFPKFWIYMMDISFALSLAFILKLFDVKELLLIIRQEK